MTIGTKILWILAVPFLGFLGYAGWKVSEDQRSLVTGHEAVQAAETESLVSALVHQLQLERGLTSGFLTSKGAQFAAELKTQRPKTNQAMDVLKSNRGEVEPELAKLDSLRQSVDGLGTTPGMAIDFYTTAIRTLLNGVAASAARSTGEVLPGKLTSYFFFLSVKEFTGQLRASLNAGLAAGQFDPASLARLYAVLAARDEGQRNFERFSTSEDQAVVAPILADPAVAHADQMVQTVLGALPSGPFPFDAATLFSAMTAKIDVMKKADDALSLRLRMTATSLESQALMSLVLDGGAVIGLLILALVLTVLLSRSIRRQLGCEPPEVAAIAQSIQAGVLELPPVRGRVEGAYADLLEMVRALAVKAEALEAVAGGDLTQSFSLASDRDRLGLSLSTMVESLREMVQQILASVEQLTAGSGQVAQASQALAQGATEQAAAVQELNASATEVASQAKKNADQARGASQAARQARSEANEGKERMNELLKLVETMSASSTETKKIVKTIDDISFQVNLLALNAAVEAARAGKFGKGFGVVAEEVRSLAVRSASAVGETTKMVDAIVRSITEVSSTARLTDRKLETIAAGTVQVAEILDLLAESSLTQATALSQMQAGLDQIDQVTQSNTASAEESASAAEELSGQASELKHQVSRLRV
jgi:methyl-accepting chemotaxis protein